MKRLTLVIALLAGAGNAHAGATQQETNAKLDKNGNACLFVSTVRRYQSLDRDTLVIWGPGRNNAYLVELSMPLFGLDGSWQMAVIDHDRDGRLCGFSMDRIGIKDFGRPDSASIRSMTRLDEAELVALEEEYKVTLTRKKKDVQKTS